MVLDSSNLRHYVSLCEDAQLFFWGRKSKNCTNEEEKRKKIKELIKQSNIDSKLKIEIIRALNSLGIVSDYEYKISKLEVYAENIINFLHIKTLYSDIKF